jgi:hypothetical protein
MIEYAWSELRSLTSDINWRRARLLVPRRDDRFLLGQQSRAIAHVARALTVGWRLAALGGGRLGLPGGEGRRDLSPTAPVPVRLGTATAFLACSGPLHLSDPGKPSDPGTSLRVPPGCAGDTTRRLAAQRICRGTGPDLCMGYVVGISGRPSRIRIRRAATPSSLTAASAALKASTVFASRIAVKFAWSAMLFSISASIATDRSW